MIFGRGVALAQAVSLGGGIGLALAVLSLLVALAAAATFVSLGSQRGRVQRLEEANGDLRKEIEDIERRRARLEDDLQDANDKSIRDRSVIDHLKGEVDVMSGVFQGISGPLASMAQAMEADHKLLAGHHKEAMHGQEILYGLLLDLLHMNGDSRNRQTIAQAMRVVDRPDDGA